MMCIYQCRISGSMVFSNPLWQVLDTCCMDAASLAAAVCGSRAHQPVTGPAVRRAFRVVLQGVVSEREGLAPEDEPHGGGSAVNDGSGTSYGGGLFDVSGRSEAVVAECLWEVLDGWPPALVAAFLRFTTGTDRCVVECPAVWPSAQHAVASKDMAA
jgi:hypothetical protein